MAERRFTTAEGADSARRVVQFFDDLAAGSAWCIRDAENVVLQPFYAALDIDRRLCWTDDRSRAERFATKQAAERFAVDRATHEVVIVRCR